MPERVKRDLRQLPVSHGIALPIGNAVRVRPVAFDGAEHGRIGRQVPSAKLQAQLELLAPMLAERRDRERGQRDSAALQGPARK